MNPVRGSRLYSSGRHCGPLTPVEMKRTFQPKKLHRRRVHGFLTRMDTPGGIRVIKARRLKGRKRLTPGGRKLLP